MKRLALFFLMLTASIGWAVAQNRTITGTVTSGEDKEPVMFANVVVEGNTSIGTTTDVDGKFTLSVPASAKKLTFSYVGLKTISVPITKVMNVVMTTDDQTLDQVVVVGYGSGQKLSTISGSMARVSGEQIAEKPVANVMDALQGKVAGMNVTTSSGDPNAVASVSIHGQGSLTAGTAPLYIVDGMQTDLSTVMAMNSNDIESMNVLMDASSTSIYGARAANGVVVITTKRGKRSEEGIGHITVNAQYGVSMIGNRKPFEQMMTGDELLEFQAQNGYLKPYNWGNAPYTKVNLLDQLAANSRNKVESYAWPFNPYKTDEFYDPDAEDFDLSKYYNPNDYNFDWLNYYMGKKAPSYQADISMSGGSNRTQYYISMGTLSQEGIARGRNAFTRYNGRVGVDTKVKDWLKVGVNAFGAYTKQDAAGFEQSNAINRGTLGAFLQPRYLTPFDSTGQLRRYFYSDALGDYIVPIEREEEYFKAFDHTYQANIASYAEVTPVKGLILKTQAGLDLSHNVYSAGFKTGAYWMTDKRGSRTEYRGLGTNFTWTNTAEYRFSFADLHKMTILLGQEWVQARSNAIQASVRGIEDDDFNLLGNGSNEPSDLRLPSQSKGGYNYLSFFGRVNYSFDNYLHLDLSLRSDASSRFGADRRTGLFYSVGATYDIYRAHLEHVKWLNTLRLRASWGTTGNSSIPSLSFMALADQVNYRGAFGLGSGTIGNPDLGWEKQSNLNVGVDFDAFDDRFHSVLNLYHRITDDMLMFVPQPYASGYAGRYENIGSLTNSGIDLSLSYDFVRTRDWNVYASVIMNYNLERVTKLFHGLDEYREPNKSLIYKVGGPVQYLMAHFAGVDPETGKQLWYEVDANGNKTDKTTDRYTINLLAPTGYAMNAPFNGGLAFGASWKGLALDVNLTYSAGKYLLNNDRFFTENTSRGFISTNKSRKLLDAWTEDNRDTDVPKFGEALKFDSRLIEKASYIRLKDVRLSYSLPSEWFEKIGLISGVRVYVTGRNLLTLTPYSGFDPESASNLSLNQYPNTRQYVGGLQVTF